ncbi:MAG: peptidylprolyl isomerase [Candidatus Zixiibacteriota bacterium]
MTQAQNGNKVQVHYKGRLEDGTVFDQSQPDQPLEFQLGAGQVIPGFDKAVQGMAAGDEKTVTIQCAEAYGDHREDLVMNVSRDRIPPDLNVEVGQRLQMERNDGQKIPVTVTQLDDQSVTLDANHPLAGKDLTFDIKLVNIS